MTRDREQGDLLDPRQVGDGPADAPAVVTAETHGVTDETRRRLLEVALYTPPAIVGTLLLADEARAQTSCGPNVCAPGKACGPDDPCNPDDPTPCNPASCNPNAP